MSKLKIAILAMAMVFSAFVVGFSDTDKSLSEIVIKLRDRGDENAIEKICQIIIYRIKHDAGGDADLAAEIARRLESEVHSSGVLKPEVKKYLRLFLRNSLLDMRASGELVVKEKRENSTFVLSPPYEEKVFSCKFSPSETTEVVSSCEAIKINGRMVEENSGPNFSERIGNFFSQKAESIAKIVQRKDRERGSGFEKTIPREEEISLGNVAKKILGPKENARWAIFGIIIGMGFFIVLIFYRDSAPRKERGINRMVMVVSVPLAIIFFIAFEGFLNMLIGEPASIFKTLKWRELGYFFYHLTLFLLSAVLAQLVCQTIGETLKTSFREARPHEE